MSFELSGQNPKIFEAKKLNQRPAKCAIAQAECLWAAHALQVCLIEQAPGTASCTGTSHSSDLAAKAPAASSNPSAGPPPLVQLAGNPIRRAARCSPTPTSCALGRPTYPVLDYHPAGPGPERAPSATCCLLPPRTFLSSLPSSQF